MNINSLIDWKEGLELTPETFITLEDNLSRRVQTASRIMGHNAVGILPNSTFDCEATFVNKGVEIARLRCQALLRSGRILDIDEMVTLPMPMLYGSEYLMAVREERRQEQSEERGVPILRPQYTYSIVTLEEVERDEELFPLVKLLVRDGLFNIDKGYLPACIELKSMGEVIPTLLLELGELLMKIAQHPNFESGDGQRVFVRFAYLLQNYSTRATSDEFARLLQEITLAAEYFIMQPNGHTIRAVVDYSIYDLERWFRYTREYLSGVISLLDGVVLIDHTIDMEQLKTQVKSELYQEVYDSIFEKISAQITGSLKEQIREEVRRDIVEHINSDIRAILKEELHRDLSQDLKEALHETLYERLYDALYVKPQEVEEIIPIM